MDETRLIAEYRLHVEVGHSGRLLSTIDHLLNECKTSLADLDGIAVSIGPGSFTGLRVGLATAKGLSIGAGKPIVTVPTLEAMAAAFPYCKALIAPLLDARRNEVYWALFDHQGEALTRRHPDAATSLEEALARIDPLTPGSGEGAGHQEILFVGDGMTRYRKLIQERLKGRALFPSRSAQFPSAACVAELGLSRLLKGEAESKEEALPVYLRASEAELKWKAPRDTVGFQKDHEE